MSDTTIINIRTNIKIKTKAQDIAKKLGLSLSAVINTYLKQLIRTKTISLSLEKQPSAFLLQSLTESKKDIKNGYISPIFDNIEEADKWLDDPKAKYANQIRKKV